jgi:hypothetical protein
MYKTREKKKCQINDPDIIIQCGSGLIEKAFGTVILFVKPQQKWSPHPSPPRPHPK